MSFQEELGGVGVALVGGKVVGGGWWAEVHTPVNHQFEVGIRDEWWDYELVGRADQRGQRIKASGVPGMCLVELGQALRIELRQFCMAVSW
jgi:hypothetical protein